jgi:hypothetical protein
MAYRPKTDVHDDGPRKKAAARGHLIHNGIHIRTGLPVRDATEPRYLTVEDEDSRKATRNDPRKCAFSQCARRVIPGLVDVEFYVSKAYLIFTDHVVRYHIAGSTGRAIYAFDLTGEFKPGQYYLSAITATERMTHPRRGRPAVKQEEKKKSSQDKRSSEKPIGKVSAKVTAARVSTKNDGRRRPLDDSETVHAGPVGRIMRSIKE